VAGTSGTLVGRFGGTALAGDLRAKTGTTVPTRSLAGCFTTSSGQIAVFSVVVNGSDTDPPISAEAAIDELVVRLAAAL
jgi:D-alanyl-D-alanine carboxypeptidase/D-alanyl-D-alanine-endopeptidase (penicillin-binding protein 4)